MDNKVKIPNGWQVVSEGVVKKGDYIGLNREGRWFKAVMTVGNPVDSVCRAGYEWVIRPAFSTNPNDPS